MILKYEKTKYEKFNTFKSTSEDAPFLVNTFVNCLRLDTR